MKLNKKYLIIVIGAIALLLLLAILSTVGTVNLELKEIISALINNDNKMVTTIVYKMRLPRNILAAIVGANLAVAGVLLQSVMKNPLADPGITGVSTGASVAAIIILLLLLCGDELLEWIFCNPEMLIWIVILILFFGAFDFF